MDREYLKNTIWTTGDCHAEFDKFSEDVFEEQLNMLQKDKDNNIMIVCGDFGGVWYSHNSDWYRNECKKLDWLERLPFTITFCDGNHENFDRLSTEFPEKEWNGGKVHEIRPHVLHLMRGEIYNINEKKFFVFGGARSHDIRDGVINPNDYNSWDEFINEAHSWRDAGLQFRIKGVSWWAEEMPSKEEMIYGWENLKKNDFKVDYIITHCASSSTQALLSYGEFRPDELTRYFEDIRSSTEYKAWLCGHYHFDRSINGKDFVLYDQIVRIV